MNYGYKIVNEKASCLNCNGVVGNDKAPLVNFCPTCGAPMNLDAAEKYEQEQTNEKIKLLVELDERAKESESYRRVVAEMLKELKEN